MPILEHLHAVPTDVLLDDLEALPRCDDSGQCCDAGIRYLGLAAWMLLIHPHVHAGAPIGAPSSSASASSAVTSAPLPSVKAMWRPQRK